MKHITFSKSFRDFLADCENTIANELWLYHRNCETIDNYKSNFFTAEEIDYITFRNDGTISFLPKGKPHIEEDGIWKRDGRQFGKPSKIIRKVMTPIGLAAFKECDFEHFCNCYKAEYDIEGLEFRLEDRHSICDIYLAKLLPGEGSLNNSCMNGENFFDIYEYCEQLQILTLKKNNLLAGRALIWNFPKQGITIMDRIYVVKDQFVEMFYLYALKNKWWRKSEQNADSKEYFINGEGIFTKQFFTIHLDTDFDEYPYMDTFTFGGDGWLCNDIDSEYEYSYMCTGGGRENKNEDEDDTCEDGITGDRIDNDDSRHIDRGLYSGEYTHYSNIIVDADGETWWRDDNDIIEINNTFYYKFSDDVFECPITDTYYLTENGVKVEKGKYANTLLFTDITVTDVSGNIWWVDDGGIVEIEGEFYDKTADNIYKYGGIYKLIKQQLC